MSRRRASFLTVIAVISTLALPAAAAPQSINAPPGNSAIDEYLETVPGVSGNVLPRPGDGGGPSLTPAQRAELRALGSEGETLRQVVDATSPPPRKPAPTRVVPVPAPAAGESPVAAALAATTGSDDSSALGPLLPAILLASLLGVIVLSTRSRRRGSS